MSKPPSLAGSLAPRSRMLALAALALAALSPGGEARAQFAAAVTPPRFEVSVEPGQVARQVIEITHAIPGSGTYRVYTADWSMDAGGALTFYESLQPGSCRPWVAIERREVSVAMGARVRYRFEIAPPADTTPQECRFVLMFESKPQEVRSETSTFPMNGRIGVIVYATVGGARPALEAGAASVGQYDGRPTPIVSVHNSGNATGRLSGILRGTDASGATIEFTPESIPILPGQTRLVALQSYEPGLRGAAASAPSAQPVLKWPLALHGLLEYGPGGALRLELDRSVADRPAP